LQIEKTPDKRQGRERRILASSTINNIHKEEGLFKVKGREREGAGLKVGGKLRGS